MPADAARVRRLSATVDNLLWLDRERRQMPGNLRRNVYGRTSGCSWCFLDTKAHKLKKPKKNKGCHFVPKELDQKAQKRIALRSNKGMQA
jgi:hypothetical protein